MGAVARHDLDFEHSERAVVRLTNRRHEAREDIEAERLGPGFALERDYDEFAHRSVADGRVAEAETYRALVRALQAGGALFLTATRPEGELVEFRYGEDTIRRPATGPTGDSDALAWLQAMNLAIVARDRPRLELLAGVRLELLRDCGPQYTFHFAWVRALQLHALGEQGLVDAVLDALRELETAPDYAQQAVGELCFPPRELFYHYTQRAQAKFTEALRGALDLHKRHWATEPRSTTGLVALDLLAVACLARDAGMAIEVESDYLPHHLLAGSRVGELST